MKENTIPKRSPQASIPDLVDLTGFYTASLDEDWLVKKGANLSSLPKGVQAFKRAAFDIRGLIQLAGKTAKEETGIDFPERVDGMPVNFKARQIHFLQGACWSEETDTVIGEYAINYADGQVKTVPIVYGRSAVDWWIKEGDALPTCSDIAWTGVNDASKKLGYNVQLYKYTVNNPLPDVEIKSIDFISNMTNSAPFLVALTVEPTVTDYEWFDAIKCWNELMPRSKQATDDLVDLTDYFNTSMDDDWYDHSGHDFHDVPKGVQVMGDAVFDIRGLIVLGGTTTLRIAGVALPEAVKGIPVKNRKGKRIHFLQAAAFDTADGEKIGEYVIHYADGKTNVAPIIYRENIMDWWYRADTGHVKGPEAVEVWTGSNAATRRIGTTTRLIKYSWPNPRPDAEIVSIDFVSDVAKANPMLAAITIEPSETSYDLLQMVKPENTIPERSSKATDKMVDLGSFYTYSLDDFLHAKPGNHLSEFFTAVFEFDGVSFDARGAIQLAGSHSLNITGVVFPEDVKKIPVNAGGKKIHFIHASAWNPEDGNMKIGEYKILYVTGEEKSIPIVYGDNVADWWVRPGDELPKTAKVAWEGNNPKTSSLGFFIRLYKYTFENPLPDVEIESMDFVSEVVQSAPILVAVTLE